MNFLENHWICGY